MNIHQTTLVKGRRYLFEFGDRTPRNEQVVVTFERVEPCEAMRKAWRKQKSPKADLATHWAVDVYAYEDGGPCYGRYNPTVKPGGAGRIVNDDWVLEATSENISILLAEIERRAFAA